MGPVAKLRCTGGVASQDSAGGGFGVDGVDLAALATQPAVRPRHLERAHAVLVQMPGQAGAVSAGALDADATDTGRLSRPVDQPTSTLITRGPPNGVRSAGPNPLVAAVRTYPPPNGVRAVAARGLDLRS